MPQAVSNTIVEVAETIMLATFVNQCSGCSYLLNSVLPKLLYVLHCGCHAHMLWGTICACIGACLGCSQRNTPISSSRFLQLSCFFLAGFWICAIGRWLFVPFRILPLILAILKIQFSRHAKVSLFYGCFLVGDLKGGATPPCGPSFSLHEHCQKKGGRPWQTVTPCKFERKKPNIVGKCRDRPWQTVTDRDSKLFLAAHRYGSPGKTCKMKICSLEMCFVSARVFCQEQIHLPALLISGGPRLSSQH